MGWYSEIHRRRTLWSATSVTEVQRPPGRALPSSAHMESQEAPPVKSASAPSGPVVCEVCGLYFETRRGLSSHARLHLRQLGVTVSESSGAPIELLYQLIQERDGSLSAFNADPSGAGSTAPKKKPQQEPKTSSVQEEKSSTSKTGGKRSTAPQKADRHGPSGRLTEPAEPLRSAEGSSSSFSDHQSVTKPLWAPLDTDAPITLTSDTSHEAHVCQLCGCWYETRRGLSSHARAHLRQIGIPDSAIKGGPIEFLYKMMEEDPKPLSAELKGEGASSPKRPADLSSPPTSPASKRPKASEDCTCVLCGEQFENRKGLGSHARSHLRHIGVSDLVGKNSAIDTVEELVSSGMIEVMHPPKTSSSPATTSPAPPSPGLPASSPPLSQGRTVFLSSAPPQSPKTSSQVPLHPSNRAPKAKKGFRLAVDPLLRKPKPEPVEVEVSESKTSSPEDGSSVASFPAAPTSAAPLDSDLQSPPTVLCDFCGQLFETRKALSCHVRAHLRQLGLTWSIRTSPIDLLKEVMLHGEDGKAKQPWAPQGSKRPRRSLSAEEGASTSCTSPVDYSMKDKSPSGKTAAPRVDTCCQLCGFDFENRKALASHARAHLRQLGIFEWKADGATSPIELLSEIIQKDPARVAEITKRYRFGDLYIKKSQRTQRSTSPSASPDSGAVGGGSRTTFAQQELKASRKDHGSMSAHTPKGVHPLKHGVSSGQENRKPQRPPRSGSIPALLPKPPLTPLVKLVGKVYSLKCRFCDEVFHGPLSVQEQWISHLQKHILSLGYKSTEAAPPTPVTRPTLVDPVAV
uniref:C2H2-type domain-containing protein n=2 Tax=Oryzias latipes TaxID=8090 RepID=A0A3P9LC83_ORYLA